MAGPSEMIIRPWDFVPGYLISDGQPAQPLTGALDRGGEVLARAQGGRGVGAQRLRFRSLSLARVDGSVTGVSMRLPAGGWWLASPDGRGDVLLTRVGEI